MQTSNYALCGRNQNAVGISQGIPKWFTGRIYKKLAPSWNMIKLPDAQYTVAYNEILSKLDAQQVYEELGESAILLCYEKPGDFCHRQLVAEWFKTELGILVPEYEKPEITTPKKKPVAKKPEKRVETQLTMFG